MVILKKKGIQTLAIALKDLLSPVELMDFFKSYTEGNGAKHNLIVPSDATEYFTISGRSFSRNISIELHKFVHLIKYPKFLRENSPCITFVESVFLINSVTESLSDLVISHVAKGPAHLKINSFPTDLISNLSLKLDKSRIIF